MSVAVLISGSVFKEPTQRTSQSGKRYVVTTIKAAAADNTASDFWNVLAFGDTAGAELMRLAVGERLAVQGSLKIETYTAASDGSTKINRTVFVDHVLALRAPPREKKPKAAKPSTSAQQQSTAAPPFDDDVPFAPEVR